LVGKLVALGFATVMPFVLAGALLTSQSVTDTHSSAPLDSRSIVPIVPHATGSSNIGIDATDEEDEPLDFLGNTVSPAVATYKFDAIGGLYETHSPRTELPRLAPPKS